MSVFRPSSTRTPVKHFLSPLHQQHDHSTQVLYIHDALCSQLASWIASSSRVLAHTATSVITTPVTFDRNHAIIFHCKRLQAHRFAQTRYCRDYSGLYPPSSERRARKACGRAMAVREGAAAAAPGQDYVPLPPTFFAALLVALLCAAAAITLGTRHIVLHLRSYTRPEYQLHIVRVIAMVPVYSLTAFLALVVDEPRALLWLALARDSYEAYVIYNFVVLLINYGGGDRQLIYFLEGQPRLQHNWPMKRFLPPMQLGAGFINAVRAAVLQFVFVKPAVAFFKLRLFTSGISHAGTLRVFLVIIENLSVSSALYGLIIFYRAAEPVLRPYSPLPKFLSVKAVVFFSFWQGIVLSITIRLGLIRDIPGYTAHEQATGLHDVLICFEMAIASVVHYYVFSYKEYGDLTVPRSEASAHHPLLRNLGDVVDFRDVLSDAKERLAGGTGFESELRDGEPLLPGAERVLGSLSRNSNASNSSISYDLALAPWNIRTPTGFQSDPQLRDDLFDERGLGPGRSAGNAGGARHGSESNVRGDGDVDTPPLRARRDSVVSPPLSPLMSPPVSPLKRFVARK